MNRSRGPRSRWRRLADYRFLGVILVAAVLPLALASERFAAALPPRGVQEFPVPQLSVVLLVTTLGLLVNWYHVTGHETEMLQAIGEGDIPTLPAVTLPLVAAIAFALAFLMVVSDRPLLFAGLYAALKVGELWGWWAIQRTVSAGIRTARNRRLNKARKDAVDIVEGFYLGRPWLPLHGTTIAATSVALALGLYGELVADAALRRLATAAALLLLILIIVAGESIISVWRRSRDKAFPAEYTG